MRPKISPCNYHAIEIERLCVGYCINLDLHFMLKTPLVKVVLYVIKFLPLDFLDVGHRIP